MKYLFKVFIEHFAFGLTIPFSVVWMLQQGISLPEVGFVQSVIFMSTFLLEVPTGIVADKLGRKNSLILGTLAHTVGLTLFLLSSSFSGFLLSALFTGSAWAFISGAEETYLHDVITPKTGLSYKKLFARVTISDEAATLLGMLTGSVLTALFTLQTTFAVAAFFMLISVIFLFIFLPTDKDNFKIDDVVGENPQDLRTLFQRYRTFLPTFILLGILFESARILWQPALLQQGWQVAQLGLIFAGLKLFSILGSFIAERIDLSHRTAIAISGTVGGFALLGLSTSNLWLGIIGLAIYFLMENVLRINQSAYLLEIAPDNNEKTTFLSSANLIRNLSSSAASPVLGWGAANSIRMILFGLLGVKVISSFILRKKDTND